MAKMPSWMRLFVPLAVSAVVVLAAPTAPGGFNTASRFTDAVNETSLSLRTENFPSSIVMPDGTVLPPRGHLLDFVTKRDTDEATVVLTMGTQL